MKQFGCSFQLTERKMKTSKLKVAIFLVGLVFTSCFVCFSFEGDFVQADDDAAKSSGPNEIVARAATLPVNGTPLPDTGQTQSYTDTFGEDSDYFINPPSYTKLDVGGNDLPADAAKWVLVRDNVTQLIWEVKTDDGSIHDKDKKYTWQNVKDVFIAAVNAEKFGGYSNWRMPDIKELASIADLGRSGPAINTNFFPNTLSSSYWSFPTLANDTGYAWCVYFHSGCLSNNNKSDEYYVRAVRSEQ